ADLEVIENGNRDYISDEAILEWAEQWEQRGPRNVDEELRRVPFLETRDAAKEIGASIEFNKAEGVDSIDGAKPGDFIYIGVSEFNDDLAGPTNDGGDIALDRVDGGVVYRAELGPRYDVSTLEPVVVGPDFTGEEAMEDVDDSLRNVDNVYVMRDGRVLLCEDGWRGGNRSYPNDALYVYEPDETERRGPPGGDPPGHDNGRKGGGRGGNDNGRQGSGRAGNDSGRSGGRGGNDNGRQSGR
ncbi:MAG: cell surface protein, partial [Halovenus sp.]